MLKFQTVCQYIYLMCDLIYELKLGGQIQTLKSIDLLEMSEFNVLNEGHKLSFILNNNLYFDF